MFVTNKLMEYITEKVCIYQIHANVLNDGISLSWMIFRSYSPLHNWSTERKLTCGPAGGRRCRPGVELVPIGRHDQLVAAVRVRCGANVHEDDAHYRSISVLHTQTHTHKLVGGSGVNCLREQRIAEHQCSSSADMWTGLTGAAVALPLLLLLLG